MSAEHSSTQQAANGDHLPEAYTIAEFCRAHRISRTALYELWALGGGPRFMRNGVRRIITREAAADWRVERERLAQSEAAA